jgi:hypothetical protein
MTGEHRAIAVWVLAALLATSAACRRDTDDMPSAVATPTPTPTSVRFVVISDDVVLDRRTGLAWARRDHGQSLPWDEADRHCRERERDDAPAWRLPELAEIEALYDPSRDEPCGDRRCRLDPAITLGGPYVWTASDRGVGTRFYFDFSAGNSFSPGLTPLLVRRTLCVRGSGAPG